MSINYPGNIDTELLITTYITDLKREYLPNDIFDALSSEYINPSSGNPPAMPNAIYLKLQAAEIDKGRYTKVAMLKDLTQAPNLGSTADPRLNEEDYNTKWFRMEYTDLSHATTNQNYGITARDKAPYQIFEQRTDLLARYFKQYFGKMRRQTLLETQSENLETAPHFNTSVISPNWFIPNRRFSEQPVKLRDPHDRVDAVVAALHGAGTGINACCSPNYLIKLESWARTEAFIVPLDDIGGGKSGYIVTLPTPQIDWLLNVVQNGNFGKMWTDAAQLGADVVAAFPGAVGRFRGLMIVEDERYPTITLGGSASYGQEGDGYNFTSDSGEDFTILCQYRGMGNADDGSSDPRDKTATARQVGFLIGKGAVVEWMPEGFHWEWEYTMYDKYFGSGIFCSVGMKMPIFDSSDGITAKSNRTQQQNSSIVLPFAAPSETNYYSSLTA